MQSSRPKTCVYFLMISEKLHGKGNMTHSSLLSCSLSPAHFRSNCRVLLLSQPRVGFTIRSVRVQLSKILGVQNTCSSWTLLLDSRMGDIISHDLRNRQLLTYEPVEFENNSLQFNTSKKLEIFLEKCVGLTSN